MMLRALGSWLTVGRCELATGGHEWRQAPGHVISSTKHTPHARSGRHAWRHSRAGAASHWKLGFTDGSDLGKSLELTVHSVTDNFGASLTASRGIATASGQEVEIAEDILLRYDVTCYGFLGVIALST
eukprot:155868-Amphidinium_carterae.2